MTNLTGTTLGSHRILEQLGIGGMATVYKAYQPALNRYVALKILPQFLAREPEFMGRFQREAMILARLQHPNIPAVYDAHCDGELAYLVMEYVEADTLWDKLTQGPLRLGESNRIVGQVCSALDYAHGRGIVHRDVKPSNVLIDAEGKALLSDLGIAKMIESTSLTGGGVGIGTPEYMSPEQAQGAEADARSDIYSLGVVLYEMVTGQVPFQAWTPMAVLHMHVHEALPLPRSIQRDLSEVVERVILRALAKEPGDRFQTAGEMALALDAAVQASPAVDQPRPVAVRAPAATDAPARASRIRSRFRLSRLLRRRPPPDEKYNLAAVRRLLVAAFTPQTLRRFCQDRNSFRRIVDDFGPNQGLNDMVDKVIDYCQKRYVWDEFLAEVQQEHPNQYARFEPNLYDGAAQSHDGTGHE